MTLEEIRNDVGSRINQYDDSTDEFVPGFVTEVELNRWINQSFEDIYKWYALANRGRFSVPATTDTVADEAVYAFGGDAEDLLALESVAIKRASTDEDYTRAYTLNPLDFYLVGKEKVPAEAPRFFERQILNTATGNYTLAIEFPEDCVPEESITDGIEIRYIERPPLMTGDTDIPEKLPRELHKLLVMGAAIPALEKMNEYDSAAYLEGKLNSKIKSFFSQEQSNIPQGGKKIRMSRRNALKFIRRI
jgi:hypothetical protein